MAVVRLVLLVVMGIFYVVAGILHFVKMDYYLTLMPPVLPWHRALVVLSGLAEIALGIAVLVPATRVMAAWGIVALLIAVFPANLYAAIAHVPGSGGYPRLPLQALFILWGVVVHAVMRIRPGTSADLDALVAHNLAMARETEDLSLDPDVLRPGVAAVLEGKVDGFYRVAEEGGAVVAQLMITREWSDWRNGFVWWIQSVYVVPDARGRGLFAALYTHVQTEARSAGAAGLRLYVDVRNAPAREVYARLGMRGDHYQVFEAMFDRA